MDLQDRTLGGACVVPLLCLGMAMLMWSGFAWEEESFIQRLGPRER